MSRLGAVWPRILQVLTVGLITLAGIAIVLVLIGLLPWSSNWDIWSVLTAMGTVGATSVALVLALRSWAQERDATARFVSAWVTDEYRPRQDGSSYTRVVHLHVANESNEPVFNAMVNVHIGRASTPLGPLAAPAPVSVIPPRRELVFDISVPLLAHGDSWSPRASVTFADPKGRYWIREVDGGLRDVSRSASRWSAAPRPGDTRQLGDEASLFNPMQIAMAFLGALRSDRNADEDVSILLSPQAPGWNNVDWDQLRRDVADLQPTSMVDFPAPRIARIKLTGDRALEGRTVEGAGRPLEMHFAMFMTLVLDPRLGWTVFGIGGNVAPDDIDFGGSLAVEIDQHRRVAPSPDDQPPT